MCLSLDHKCLIHKCNFSWHLFHVNCATSEKLAWSVSVQHRGDVCMCWQPEDREHETAKYQDKDGCSVFKYQHVHTPSNIFWKINECVPALPKRLRIFFHACLLLHCHFVSCHFLFFDHENSFVTKSEFLVHEMNDVTLLNYANNNEYDLSPGLKYLSNEFFTICKMISRETWNTIFYDII